MLLVVCCLSHLCDLVEFQYNFTCFWIVFIVESCGVLVIYCGCKVEDECNAYKTWLLIISKALLIVLIPSPI